MIVNYNSDTNIEDPEDTPRNIKVEISTGAVTRTNYAG